MKYDEFIFKFRIILFCKLNNFILYIRLVNDGVYMKWLDIKCVSKKWDK